MFIFAQYVTEARQGGETATEEEKNVLGTLISDLVDVCGKAIETVLW